jgi:hypothetical protein
MEEQEDTVIAETIEEKKEEHFSIIDFFNLTKEEYEEEKVALKIQEKLGTSLFQMKETISAYVIAHAEELTLEFPNIAPLGDYGKLIENNDDMTEFLKTEGHKPEHWKLHTILLSDVNKELLSFHFWNTGVDDGTTFQGFCFTTKTGKIKHVFAQVEE